MILGARSKKTLVFHVTIILSARFETANNVDPVPLCQRQCSLIGWVNCFFRKTAELMYSVVLSAYCNPVYNVRKKNIKELFVKFYPLYEIISKVRKINFELWIRRNILHMSIPEVLQSNATKTCNSIEWDLKIELKGHIDGCSEPQARGRFESPRCFQSNAFHASFSLRVDNRKLWRTFWHHGHVPVCPKAPSTIFCFLYSTVPTPWWFIANRYLFVLWKSFWLSHTCLEQKKNWRLFCWLVTLCET